ncbi:hypothetical protein IFM89_036003 [Coptis chinensis]|uniref:Uncharacterized protein n=1 Tax=Coptis chinensis TaxID=261450 RepID=A0A835IUR2_9MAGN|nr:hypothetical protein IFM89_036003 [Coptis chinensis]
MISCKGGNWGWLSEGTGQMLHLYYVKLIKALSVEACGCGSAENNVSLFSQILLASQHLRSHEDMSVDMVDYIVDEHHIDVDSGILKRAKEMILASSEIAVPQRTGEKRFLYDIVANGRNGIDVDKFDYIKCDCRACGLGFNFQFGRLMETMRVMGDEICYPAKEYLSVQKLFATHADLYRTAIELMLVDALVKANSFLNISSHINDPSEYWKLDDAIVKTTETATEGNGRNPGI